MEYWPFIILLPYKSVLQYRTLTSIFSSEVALDILKSINLDGKTYQRDLVKKLSHHSNKSIIKYLKIFVELEILEEGVEKVVVDGKSMWIKWYKPTFLGKWFILLIKPKEMFSPMDIKNALEDLLKLYAKSIVKLCSTFNLDLEYFRKVFNEALEK
ncbi:MAG: hypothetical protein NDF57_03780 [archaeon GBS-70-058]|nr:hypothetical protein [Candidatus Culexarchaeum nevadense]